MSQQPPPRSSPYRSRPDEPVDDAERARVGERLNAAFEAGALNEDSYRARLDLLYAATTLGQLVPVVEGLPPLATFDVPAIVSAGRGAAAPGELAPTRGGRGLSLGVTAGVVGAALLVVLLLLVLLG